MIKEIHIVGMNKEYRWCQVMRFLPDNYAMGVTRMLQEVWLQFNAAIWVVTTWVSNNQSSKFYHVISSNLSFTSQITFNFFGDLFANCSFEAINLLSLWNFYNFGKIPHALWMTSKSFGGHLLHLYFIWLSSILIKQWQGL